MSVVFSSAGGSCRVREITTFGAAMSAAKLGSSPAADANPAISR